MIDAEGTAADKKIACCNPPTIGSAFRDGFFKTDDRTQIKHSSYINLEDDWHPNYYYDPEKQSAQTLRDTIELRSLREE